MLIALLRPYTVKHNAAESKGYPNMSAQRGIPLVILAAGKGTRIRADGETLPKPLLKVLGVPLLKRTILTAHNAGIQRFVVVLGYEAEQVRGALSQDRQLSDLKIEWISHELYDLSNGVSVLQARPMIEGEFLLTMADHVFEPAFYTDFLKKPLKGDVALAVDYKLDDIFDMNDATKVKVGDGSRILRIDKELTEYDAVDTGLFHCTPAIFDSLQAVLDETGDASLSMGVQRLADQNQAHVVDVGDNWWQDVDNLAMHAEAERRLVTRRGLTKSA